MREYDDELDLAVDYATESLPKDAYAAARFALYEGPGCGASMSFDEAVAKLEAWANGIQDWVIEDYVEVPDFVGADCEDGCEEVLVEVGRIDRRDIVKAVLGADLAEYV
jgi:hypothetical protein